MYKRGFTLVEIIIILSIIILSAVVAVPYLATSGKAGAMTARDNLHKLSIAAENYASSHSGVYPVSVAELAEYVNLVGSYCVNAAGAPTVVGEYSYACVLSGGGYNFTASPVIAGVNGSVTYTATTGGVLTP